MTPRERAEKIYNDLAMPPRSKEGWIAIFEAAITEHVRALADDEATIEAMAQAMMPPDATAGSLQHQYARAALAALRRKAGAE